MATETLFTRLLRQAKPLRARPTSRPAAEAPLLEEDPREKKRYYLENTTTRHVLTHLLTAIFSLIMDLRIYGLEHLPKTGGVILAANHLTNFDVVSMQIAVPRLIFFMGKEELFRNILLDAVLRRMGGFPVHRGAGDQWALKHARRVLDAGQVCGIFPEGSRSKGRGLRAGKTGAARLALESGCPILPMAVNGTQHMFKGFFKRVPVTIHLGPPIYPTPGESPLELTDRLMFTLADMLPAELRGMYAQKPEGF